MEYFDHVFPSTKVIIAVVIRSRESGQEVVVATKLDIVGHKPLSSCIPRSLQGAAPTITGWYSTLMIQSGETARCRGGSRGWCYLT